MRKTFLAAAAVVLVASLAESADRHPIATTTASAI